MRTEELLAQIKKQLSIFVTEVKSSCAMGSTDINRIAESLLIPILREAYGYQDLKNLNRTSANYPAVDLGDEVRRVAIQVTSTPSTKKV
ncbi:MAG: SMEK domain-containing protein, partial [Cyanobacteria bacterium J06631_12]